MTDLPKAVYSSELEICGVTLRCHVLDNGQRVFEVQGVHDLMTAWANGAPLSDAESAALAQFMPSQAERTDT